MTHSSSVAHLAPEFEDFLFAPVGEDGHGMLLSVLSALARLNVDPWQEAAKLAGLPVEAATRRLTSLIAALPDGPSAHRDPGTIAVRLVALLPRRVVSQIPARTTVLGAGATPQSRAILFAIFLALMLAAHYIVANRQSPAQVGDTHAPISSTVSPPMSPPRSDR